MSRHAVLIALSALVVAGITSTTLPARAGGDVIERAPKHVRHHHHRVRRITLLEESAPLASYAEPAPVQQNTGPRIRRGNFHGRFVGGNYAYNSNYQDVLTATNNDYVANHRSSPFVSADIVDPDAPESVYHSGVPHSRSTTVPERGGGGIYDKSTSLMPAPTRGILYENRTRDSYVYSYDYETENPACWSTINVGGESRSVWTCAGR